MPWKKLLVWATGQIDEALRQKLEFVLEENRVYRVLLDRHSPHWRLQDPERKVLAQKGKPLGKLLGDVITIVQPQTLLKWHRRLIASKWDFSHRRTAKPGRPFVPAEVQQLVLQFAHENPAWGYDRIVGALANLGHRVSDQTVGNILKRHGLGPAPERKRNTTWAAFIRRHKEVLRATDFFTAEVWTATGLTTFDVLFFLHLQTRRVILAGITTFPNEAWLKQVARNLTVDDGPITNVCYLLHGRRGHYFNRRSQRGLFEIKTVGHGIGCRIAGTECRETECRLAKLDDADVGVEGFGNSFPRVGTHHQTPHAWPVTELRVRIGQTMRGAGTLPGISEWRFDMIIPTSPIIPSDKDCRRRPILAFGYFADPVSSPLHAQLDTCLLYTSDAAEEQRGV